MTEVTIPNRNELIDPVFQAVRELGGSGRNQEIHDKVISMLQLSDEQVAMPTKPGASGTSLLALRLGWARSDLKGMGLLINSERGVWSLTEKGRSTSEVDGKEVRRAIDNALKQAKKRDAEPQPAIDTADDDELDGPVDDGGQNWRETLRAALQNMDPTAFERLCQRMLRESGFTQVVVTGKSGDGGIDGIGVFRMGGFLSFRVLFQCKRYRGAVSAGAVRDFRGAMTGRTDKGLIVTTGNFTPAAVREATRDGAPEIDLIDGEQLIDKLTELELGVRMEQVTVERVVVDREWFGAV